MPDFTCRPARYLPPARDQAISAYLVGKPQTASLQRKIESGVHAWLENGAVIQTDAVPNSCAGLVSAVARGSNTQLERCAAAGRGAMSSTEYVFTDVASGKWVRPICAISGMRTHAMPAASGEVEYYCTWDHGLSAAAKLNALTSAADVTAAEAVMTHTPPAQPSAGPSSKQSSSAAGRWIFERSLRCPQLAVKYWRTCCQYALHDVLRAVIVAHQLAPPESCTPETTTQKLLSIASRHAPAAAAIEKLYDLNAAAAGVAEPGSSCGAPRSIFAYVQAAGYMASVADTHEWPRSTGIACRATLPTPHQLSEDYYAAVGKAGQVLACAAEPAVFVDDTGCTAAPCVVLQGFASGAGHIAHVMPAPAGQALPETSSGSPWWKVHCGTGLSKEAQGFDTCLAQGATPSQALIAAATGAAYFEVQPGRFLQSSAHHAGASTTKPTSNSPGTPWTLASSAAVRLQAVDALITPVVARVWRHFFFLELVPACLAVLQAAGLADPAMPAALRGRLSACPLRLGAGMITAAGVQARGWPGAVLSAAQVAADMRNRAGLQMRLVASIAAAGRAAPPLGVIYKQHDGGLPLFRACVRRLMPGCEEAAAEWEHAGPRRLLGEIANAAAGHVSWEAVRETVRRAPWWERMVAACELAHVPREYEHDSVLVATARVVPRQGMQAWMPTPEVAQADMCPYVALMPPTLGEVHKAMHFQSASTR